MKAAIVLVFTLFTGCGGSSEPPSNQMAEPLSCVVRDGAAYCKGA